MAKKIIAYEVSDHGIFNELFGLVCLERIDDAQRVAKALLQEDDSTLVCIGWNGRFGLSLQEKDRTALKAGTFTEENYKDMWFAVYPYLSPAEFKKLHGPKPGLAPSM